MLIVRRVGLGSVVRFRISSFEFRVSVSGLGSEFGFWFWARVLSSGFRVLGHGVYGVGCTSGLFLGFWVQSSRVLAWGVGFKV